MRVVQCCAGSVALAILSWSVLGAAEKKPITIRVISSAFQNGQPIPAKYTCDGEDASPPLSWSGVPADVKSFALICDDPDAPAGTWVHWVLCGVPGSTAELPEKTPADETLQNGARQGINDFKKTGYGGPCPPSGKPHRYFFKLYALDTEITLKPRATKKELLKAMDGHIVSQGELVGTYQRKR